MSLDQFPLDAVHLVSHMPPPDPRPLSPLPSDDGHSSNASRPASSQDPYYTNDDIAALHAVVVAAQHILDSTPEPKPLPAAALFNAYDTILPNYGIDPDTDHHLSAFIFRIGGEGGNGSLIDKFQAILGRMGIVLEFGDNTTDSSRPSYPASSPRVSFERQEQGSPKQSSYRIPDDEIERRQSSPPSIIGFPNTDHRNYESFHIDPDEDEIRVKAQRAALSTILGRWRSQALEKKQRPQLDRIEEIPQETTNTAPQPNQVNINPSQLEEARPSTREGQTDSRRENGLEHQVGGGETIASVKSHQDSLRSLLDPPHLINTNIQSLAGDQPQSNNTPTASRPEATITHGDGSLNHRLAQIPNPESLHTTSLRVQEVVSSGEDMEVVAVIDPEEGVTERLSKSPEQQVDKRRPTTPVQCPKEPSMAELQLVHQRVMRQAERARELYLASKVFNHWADRTARRLERDAVARRHMIRFRYFRAWTHAPVSREQTIDHMRSALVVKKWQRIAAQDENLGRIAKEIATRYRFKTIHRILNQWSCQRLQHVSRDILASRSRHRALSNWRFKSSADQQLFEAIESRSKLEREQDVLVKWRNHANKQAVQAYTSQRIAIIQQTFDHIRNWWDQTEIERRGIAFRQRWLIKKARCAFDYWNLQARAQAFIWRREYVSVTRIFDKWCHHAKKMRQLQCDAQHCYERRAKSIFLQYVRSQDAQLLQLTRLESRACLYIRGTLMLKVFDKGIKQRKDRDKEHVKRYLMARFTQVSSARKKRNFFAALNRWAECAARNSMLAQQSLDLKTRNEARQQLGFLQLWNKQAELDQGALDEARLQHGQGLLEVWKDHTTYLEERDIEAWQLWASERQRNCLKEWSIASLQQSGQAHTASEVRKKHDRQKRNRYVQQWRQLGDRLKPDVGTESLRASAIYRGSWRALSGRRSVIRRNDKVPDYPASAVETPTRWTGQPTAVSSILPASSMAPVREADEDGASSTTAEDVGIVTSPSKKAQDRRANRFFLMSSTTPRAPVPLYLERGFRESDDDFELDENDNVGRSSQHRMPVGSMQRTAGIPIPPESIKPETYERLPSLSRAPAPVKSAGSRAIDERSLGIQPNNQSLARAVASRSVGTKPSGLRYGVNQSSRAVPSARSVRIRSPKSFAITTPRPTEAPR